MSQPTSTGNGGLDRRLELGIGVCFGTFFGLILGIVALASGATALVPLPLLAIPLQLALARPGRGRLPVSSWTWPLVAVAAAAIVAFVLPQSAVLPEAIAAVLLLAGLLFAAAFIDSRAS